MDHTLEAPQGMYADTMYPPPSYESVAVPSAPVEIPSVHVEIYDQIYHLRGVDPDYIQQLATMVDEKMRAVSAHGGTVDSLRVAVLAALNIADELNNLRESYDRLRESQQARSQQPDTSIRSRADSLSGMLDELLEDRRVG
jgi:cell division protein ZapA